MTLIVPFLVLFVSILCMSPYLLAYKVPAQRDQQWTSTSYESQIPNNYLNSKNSKANSHLLQKSILYLNNLLSAHQLYGLWHSVTGQNEKDLGDQEGFTTLKYAADYQTYEETFDMILCMYNGLYTNTNYTCVTFSEFIPFITDSQFDQKDMILNFQNITIHMAEGVTNGINNLGYECVVNTTISFLDIDGDGPLKTNYKNAAYDKDNFGVRFRIQGPGCGINIVTEKMTTEDPLTKGQALAYCVTMSAFALIQIGLCMGFNKILTQRKSLCEKINQGTVRTIGCFDLYLTMESILQFGNNLLVSSIAIPYAMLSIYFETKTIRTIVLAQGNLAERGLSKLNLINSFFFIVAVFIATTSAFFQRPEWIFALFSLHQIPQIVQNFISERKHRPRQFLVMLFVLPKIIYIYYVLGFPRNLFRYSPNVTLLSVIGSIFLLTVLTLLIQTKYPKFCFKSKSEYQFFEVPENGKEVCSICLEELDSPAPTPSTPSTAGLDESMISDKSIHNDINTSLLQPAKLEKMTMVVTPCKHQFHECCIRDWAKLKSLCPYCRATLPPLPEVDDDE